MTSVDELFKVSAAFLELVLKMLTSEEIGRCRELQAQI